MLHIPKVYMQAQIFWAYVGYSYSLIFPVIHQTFDIANVMDVNVNSTFNLI